MKQTSRKLLKRLLGAPRPSEKALSELFMEMQKHSVADLLRICQEILQATPPGQSSPLEASTKKRLREVDGKAADFVPYLLDEVSRRLSVSVGELGLGKKPSLGNVVRLAEESLDTSAQTAIGAALDAYVRDHDTSYKLHNA
jgi:hypothetical protein